MIINLSCTFMKMIKKAKIDFEANHKMHLFFSRLDNSELFLALNKMNKKITTQFLGKESHIS